MLQTVNQRLGKLMPILTPLSVLIGILLAEYLDGFASLVPYIFAVMTFAGSLNSNFRSLHYTLTRPVPILLILSILHIIMPLWAFAVGHVTFPNDKLLITGLMISVIIPTGVTSVVWVAMLKGNMSLALSAVLIDTLLSPIVVPLSLKIFIGESVHFPIGGLIQGLLIMVVLPSILGMAVNQFLNQAYTKKWANTLAPFSKIGLMSVVMINSAVVAPYFQKINAEFLAIAATVFFIALSGYFFAWTMGLLAKQKSDDIISLIYTGGMRNISAGAVIAVSYFPAKVAMPVVIGMLFQQVLASFYGSLFNRFYVKVIGG